MCNKYNKHIFRKIWGQFGMQMFFCIHIYSHYNLIRPKEILKFRLLWGRISRKQVKFGILFPTQDIIWIYLFIPLQFTIERQFNWVFQNSFDKSQISGTVCMSVLTFGEYLLLIFTTYIWDLLSQLRKLLHSIFDTSCISW